MDLEITARDGEFQIVLFDKRDLFHFSTVTMLDASSNVPSKKVYSASGAEPLRFARASNNSDSFSTVIKALITRISRQGVSIEKISSVIQKFFKKHQRYFDTVCKSKQELLHLIS